MIALLAGEVLKLRTVRSSWVLLATTMSVNALAVAGVVVATAGDLGSTRNVREALGATSSGAILVLVLGILISAGEYRHRTATDTFLTTPRRWRVVTAKLVVAATTGAIFGTLAVAAAVGAGAIAFAAKGTALPLSSGEVWSTLGGAVLFATLFGAVGAATGSLIRNQVLAIAGWMAWLLVVEHIAIAFVPSVSRWLPTAAGRALVREPNAQLLSVPVAVLVLLAYAIAIGSIAIVGERHRDA